MSILDQLLGGSDQENANTSSHDSDFNFATDPNFGLDASDILHSSNWEQDSNGGNGSDMEASDFTGIGDLGIDLSAPTLIGSSSSSDEASYQDSDGGHGGLLGGLL
jgi:hypothetical protein